MKDQLSELEQQLHAMRPQCIRQDLMMRLESRISTIVETDARDIAMARTAPSALPEDLALRLEAILSRVPHPDSRKLVAFPDTRTSTPKVFGWHRFATAAAVALLGSLTALMIPAANQPEQSTASSQTISNNHMVGVDLRSFVPASQQSGLADASDQGIIWTDDRRPQRMLKLVYRDNMTFRDGKGNECQLERPRVEYIMVPATID